MLNIVTLEKQLTKNLCKGKYTMTTLLIMALSVNGGLYVGTIAFSALIAETK
jgi:hypothetical protein